MEFRVEILDYGRHGVVAKEPRTGLCGEGATKDAALDELKQRLRHHIEHDFVPPADGPVRSIQTVTV